MHSGTNNTYTFDWPWRHDFLASSRLGGGGDCPLALPTWIRPCHRGTILLTPTAVAGVGFSLLFVCLLFFARYLQKPTQLGSPNLTHRHTSSTMSLRNPLFWGQKVKGQGHESTGMGPCTLVSAGFFYIDYSKWRMARFLRHPVVHPVSFRNFQCCARYVKNYCEDTRYNTILYLQDTRYYLN